MNMVVTFQNVSKRYPHFNLDGITLGLPKGQIMGLIGPNGAGKSTTLRILMGLTHQDKGEVLVLNLPMPAQQVSAKKEIGFVSEDLRLYERATLAWHIGFIRSIYPGWDASYADKLVTRFDLKPQQKMKELSHGQRVKAALLLALARRPRLLVLDEPTTGLDPVARHEVLGELIEVLIDEERTVLFSSHDTRDVENLSDQITFMDRGRIIDSKDKERFLESWRRIRLEAPENLVLPDLPDVVSVKKSGKSIVLTTKGFHLGMAEAYGRAGAIVKKIEPLTLEEIFVANVQRSRQEAVA